MAGWGKGLYTLLPFRALGLSLTFDIRIRYHLSGRGLNIRRPYLKNVDAKMQVNEERVKSIQPRSEFT